MGPGSHPPPPPAAPDAVAVLPYGGQGLPT